MNKYNDLRKINVNAHTEKKANLTYLSWAWAVDQLLQHDPMATWTYSSPVVFGETLMVFCTVEAFGKKMTSQLPVMDHRNKAIPNPDAFQVNVAMQRCLAKAIALHGIGLYIYAGEDLPDDAEGNANAVGIATDHLFAAAEGGSAALREAIKTIPENVLIQIGAATKDEIKSFAKGKDNG